MNDMPQVVRLLPMTIDAFKHEGCLTVRDIQEKYFMGILSSKDRNGCYRYRTNIIKEKSGTVVLFQCNSSIIASAIFMGVKPFDTPENEYKGCLVFDVSSIQTFDPIYKDIMIKCWPKFKAFNQSSQKLSIDGYSALKRHRKNIKSFIDEYFSDEAIDLIPPPARIESIQYRVLRDTKIARQVKFEHNFECQICGHTIELPNGRRYAEAHHIKPLGKPHLGADIKSNIICVCPNHHAELDYGAKSLSRSLLESSDSHTIDQKYIDYHNSNIFRGR